MSSAAWFVRLYGDCASVQSCLWCSYAPRQAPQFLVVFSEQRRAARSTPPAHRTAVPDLYYTSSGNHCQQSNCRILKRFNKFGNYSQKSTIFFERTSEYGRFFLFFEKFGRFPHPIRRGGALLRPPQSTTPFNP